MLYKNQNNSIALVCSRASNWVTFKKGGLIVVLKETNITEEHPYLSHTDHAVTCSRAARMATRLLSGAYRFGNVPYENFNATFTHLKQEFKKNGALKGFECLTQTNNLVWVGFCDLAHLKAL